MSTKKKDQRHIDPVFKKVMMRFGKQHDLDLETQVEVSHLPRTIDMGADTLASHIRTCTKKNKLGSREQLGIE